jgi:hypothetical protein
MKCPVIAETGLPHRPVPSTYDPILFCDEPLTLSSFSRDPLADVCWAILELDVRGFAAP